MLSCENIVKSITPTRLTRLLCKSIQDYVWHELDELPLAHKGIVFAQNSSFVAPFAEIIAERLEAYQHTYETATALSKKCAEHFFPSPETKVSQKQLSDSLNESIKPLLFELIFK